MGGGATATMRAASKVAGFAGGVLNSGLRGSAAEQAVRKSSIPVSATLSSSSRGGADVAAIQKDDLTGEAMPRVVFAVASFDEAKEASLDPLKDALDKVYLSSAESRDLSDLSLTKFDAGNKSNGTITVTNHAMMAFKILSSNPEARDVVASIACDENVRDAVMNNSMLQDFLQSNKNNVEFKEPLIPEKTEDDDDDSSAKQPEAKESGSWFKGVFEKAKLSTANLGNRLLSKFQDIFGLAEEKEGKNDRSFEIGGSIIGLVTMVVMVVVFKRI